MGNGSSRRATPPPERSGAAGGRAAAQPTSNALTGGGGAAAPPADTYAAAPRAPHQPPPPPPPPAPSAQHYPHYSAYQQPFAPPPPPLPQAYNPPHHGAHDPTTVSAYYNSYLFPPVSSWYGRADPYAANVRYQYGAGPGRHLPFMAYQPVWPGGRAPERPQPPPLQSQQMRKVQNVVNIKKTSLRLVPDPQTPGCWNLDFTFDSIAPCSVSVFYVAEEIQNAIVPRASKQNGSSMPYDPPPRMHFTGGSNQRFSQQPGSREGLNPSKYLTSELTQDGSLTVYPLIVRLESVQRPRDSSSAEEEASTSAQSAQEDNYGPSGCSLPEWVHCQTTYATLVKKPDGQWTVKVLKQALWVEGQKYELHEVYGMESKPGDQDSADSAENELGKECVICLTERRDTVALPCGHMCMCRSCADMLRSQSNKCPICRCTVESLHQQLSDTGSNPKS